MSHKQNRKGQYSIIEQVILFGIGISLMMGFLVAFEDLGDDIQDGTSARQAELVSAFIATSSVQVIESGGQGRITLSIPETIASEKYVLRLDDRGVTVEVPGNVKTTKLNGLLNRIRMDGVMVSGDRQIDLLYTNGQVQVRPG